MLHRTPDGRRATSALTGTSYALDVEDRFTSDALDERLWLPHHLPHWSSRAGSAARYRTGDGLRLRIEPDQPPWCPEFDGGVRVSSLQTGLSAGPVGGRVGQVRFRPGLVVREAQPELRLLTPRYGLVELRARATDDPRCMAALWMVHPDARAERSTEICVAEISGRDVSTHRATVGVGLKPWGPDGPEPGPGFARVDVPVDAREPHTYSAEWTPERVAFRVDDRLVHVVDHAPDHPLQLMLGLYRFPDDHPEVAGGPLPPAGAATPEFAVEHVRVHRPLGPA